MKLIVAGSRSITDYDTVAQAIDNVRKELNITEIVSGTAKGVDKLGERYGYFNNIHIKRFPADWDTHKKAAGFIRNGEMAEYADILLALWDGESKGTHHMIGLAKKAGLKVAVVKV